MLTKKLMYPKAVAILRVAVGNLTQFDWEVRGPRVNAAITTAISTVPSQIRCAMEETPLRLGIVDERNWAALAGDVFAPSIVVVEQGFLDVVFSPFMLFAPAFVVEEATLKAVVHAFLRSRDVRFDTTTLPAQLTPAAADAVAAEVAAILTLDRLGMPDKHTAFFWLEGVADIGRANCIAETERRWRGPFGEAWRRKDVAASWRNAGCTLESLVTNLEAIPEALAD